MERVYKAKPNTNLNLDSKAYLIKDIKEEEQGITQRDLMIGRRRKEDLGFDLNLEFLRRIEASLFYIDYYIDSTSSTQRVF